MKPIQLSLPNNRNNFLGMAAIIICLTALIGSLEESSTLALPSAQEVEFQSLVDKATEDGFVRVIVGLNGNYAPFGELDSPTEVQLQVEAIESAQTQVWQQLATTESVLLATYTYFPYLAIAVDSAALNQLANMPEVKTIQEDNISTPSLASSIPVIGADDAWNAGYTGEGQTIAILDTGVDKNHSYFDNGGGGNRIVSEACYSSDGSDYSAYGITSLCPGGSYSSTAANSGLNCPTSVDGCFHGTHVAGIAAGDNGGPNIGVARDASIIAIQVFTKFEDYPIGADYFCATRGLTSPCALTYTSDQMSGLDRVLWLHNNTSLKIASVNMSLGGGEYTTICDSDARKTYIDGLRSSGIATVVATGNDGFRNAMGAPACISSAISVGATEDDDDVATFSNVTSFMDLYAPGYQITSSTPGETVAIASGTSMATPHVAGAWAILKEHTPTASVDVILAALKNSGTLVDDNRSGGTVQDIPRINVDLALNELNQPPTAVDDGAATPLNTAVIIDVLSNDTDPEMDTLTIEEVGTADHGTAVESGNAILYTPTGGYSGADFFTYTISDVHNQEDTATVTVIVDGESVFLPAIVKN